MSEDKKENENPDRSLVLRAKEWASVPATREDKVLRVIDMMRNLDWVRGKTAPELAAQWGMTTGSVENISAEASRRLRTEYADPDYAHAVLLPKLERTIDDAMTDAKTSGDGRERASHRKTAQDGIKLGMMLTGAAAPQKVEMTMERLSDEEVDKRLTELAKRVAEATRGRETVMGEVGEGDTED